MSIGLDELLGLDEIDSYYGLIELITMLVNKLRANNRATNYEITIANVEDEIGAQIDRLLYGDRRYTKNL